MATVAFSKIGGHAFQATNKLSVTAMFRAPTKSVFQASNKVASTPGLFKAAEPTVRKLAKPSR